MRTSSGCWSGVGWRSSLDAALRVMLYKKVALVCALGSNIAQPGILAKAAVALSDNKINIDGMSQSLSQVSMQFVIKREDYKRAIIVLNDALCVQ